MWDAVNVAQTLEITDEELHGHYLAGILPAYFADYRKTAERAGELTLRIAHDPNRLPVSWDVRDQLGTINVPALVIVGTYDFVCPPRFAYEMHAGMPDARLRELYESGHFGHIEEADEFAAAVKALVCDQEAGNPA